MVLEPRSASSCNTTKVVVPSRFQAQKAGLPSVRSQLEAAKAESARAEVPRQAAS